ncbi:MAG: nucleotidyltransferase domain-containing protein [Deltaproteobacteria bacterium]
MNTTTNDLSNSRMMVVSNEFNRIIEVLIKEYQPDKVVLFGSLAAGQVTEWSDIDLLVVKDTTKSFYERLEEVIEITQPMIGADIIVYTPEEIKQMEESSLFLVEEVLKKGRIVYDASKPMV